MIARGADAACEPDARQPIGLQLGLSMNIRRRPERGSVWRIAPPLTVRREDIDLAMSIFDQALTEMKDLIAKRR